MAVFFIFSDQARALKSLRLKLAKWPERTGLLEFRPAQPNSASLEVLELLEAEAQHPSHQARPIWIELTPSDAYGEMEWEAARSACLARLNESREWMMRSLRRILVIALPSEWRSRVGVVAPDLWHVRTFTAELQDGNVDLSQRVRAGQGAAQLKTILAAGDVQQARRDVQLQASIPARRELALALLKLGRQAINDGRFQAACDAAQEAVDILRALGATDAGAGRVGSDLQQVLLLLGDAELGLGQVLAAVSTHAQSVAICRALVWESKDTPEVTRRLVFALLSLADAQRQAADLDSALQSSSEALQLQREYLARVGASAQARLDLVRILGRVADALRSLGREEAALQATLEEVALCRALQAELGASSDVTPYLVFGLSDLAQSALVAPELRRSASAEALALWSGLDRERFDATYYDGVLQGIRTLDQQLNAETSLSSH